MTGKYRSNRDILKKNYEIVNHLVMGEGRARSGAVG